MILQNHEKLKKKIEIYFEVRNTRLRMPTQKHQIIHHSLYSSDGFTLSYTITKNISSISQANLENLKKRDI